MRLTRCNHNVITREPEAATETVEPRTAPVQLRLTKIGLETTLKKPFEQLRGAGALV